MTYKIPMGTPRIGRQTQGSKPKGLITRLQKIKTEIKALQRAALQVQGNRTKFQEVRKQRTAVIMSLFKLQSKKQKEQIILQEIQHSLNILCLFIGQPYSQGQMREQPNEAKDGIFFSALIGNLIEVEAKSEAINTWIKSFEKQIARIQALRY